MARFQVGDTVYATRNDGPVAIGMRGIVQEHSEVPHVQWHGMTGGHGGVNWQGEGVDCWAMLQEDLAEAPLPGSRIEDRLAALEARVASLEARA